MNQSIALPAISGWQKWLGYALSGISVAMLLFSASLKLSHAPAFAAKWAASGFPPETLTPVGILEVICSLVYVIPRTRFFGAVLLSAYLGGAVATHVHASEPFAIPVILGIFVWAGLTLRDGRLRETILGSISGN